MQGVMTTQLSKAIHKARRTQSRLMRPESRARFACALWTLLERSHPAESLRAPTALEAELDGLAAYHWGRAMRVRYAPAR